MNLNDTLKKIAIDYKLNGDDLIAYANEDTIGGYHTDPVSAKWPIGSIWEVEGKILYALIRHFKPLRVLEVGRFHGCSTTHICEALIKNGNKGKLVSIDIAPIIKLPTKYRSMITQQSIDLFKYVWPSRPKIDFVFEDGLHSEDTCAHIWKQFEAKSKAGAVIVSHDAEHYIVGVEVKAGIRQVTDAFKSYLIPPSDCGLAIWKK